MGERAWARWVSMPSIFFAVPVAMHLNIKFVPVVTMDLRYLIKLRCISRQQQKIEENAYFLASHIMLFYNKLGNLKQRIVFLNQF